MRPMLRSVLGRLLGLDASDNLVLHGTRIYYGDDDSGPQGFVDLSQLESLALRVQVAPDGTSITPTSDTADQVDQTNTQAGGTLTVNAPTGSPTDGQRLTMRIKCTNVQTYAWNAIYRGSSSAALPSATTGSSKTDYIGFIYDATDSRWDFVSLVAGF